MRAAAALSTDSDWRIALRFVCDEVRQVVARPNLAVLFASHDHIDHFDALAVEACEQLGTESLLGCSAESVVGGAREVESSPAIALWTSELEAPLHLAHLGFERTPDGGALSGWPAALGESCPPDPLMLVLGEPFSFPADWLLDRLCQDHPRLQIAGGMASGAQAPGVNRLIIGRRSVSEGAVAVVSGAPLRMRTVVSQGCRPIGKPLVITRAERNLIYDLGGRPAMECLREIFQELPNRDQLLAQRGLHVGRVVDEHQDAARRGEFLIRNVLGFDEDREGIAVGDYLRVGQTMQFHLRDRESASAELHRLLAAAGREFAAPAGGLVFTCNGRGARLFDQPNHDAEAIEGAFPGLPVAGLFAQGEIGPVGGRSFVHGFTASVALLSEA